VIAYLIDSDIVIDYRGGVASVQAFVDPLLVDGIAVSVITVMEVYQGLLRLPLPSSAAVEVETFLRGIGVLPVTREVALRCAGIRVGLQGRGKSVRPRSLDLLIAATAIEHDLTLVTRNVSDYADVPGLRLLTPPGGESAGS